MPNNDRRQVCWAAECLGFSGPDVQRFEEEAVQQAARLLDGDGGAAWERVARELARTGQLTGDQVRALVGSSDEGTRP
jgi:hypothetical protein